MDKDKYFAARESEEAASVILGKADKWFKNLDTIGYLDKLKEMWAAYHGSYYTNIGEGHRITFSGEQGELVNLPVNHLRNIARHILVMVTSNRPAMQARATNTDYKTLVQTKLANGLLDYYLREKRLEHYLHRAVELAIVLGSGYVKMEWNSLAGEIYDADEITDETSGEVLEKAVQYEGDIVFSNLSPFDVVFDSTKEDSTQHDWVLCRSFKNRYDVIAKYPEFKDDIMRMETKSDKERFDFISPLYDETDDITIYEFYHKRTESMPEGRYMMFLDKNVVLHDGDMPYRDLPVYRIAPSDILGTPYGYSDVFDLLPIQDALNSLYSTVLSNQSAFGVQNVMMPRGSDIHPQTLVGGMNIIEYNAQFGKPESLNLTNTPPEVFNFIEMLEKTAETISGVNSVARGNPEASLKSGNALALVQSMSLQFISGLQQSYVKLIEDTGTGLINILKDFADSPRVATIVGKANTTYLEEFKGDDLSNINRVIVDMGNPLAKTTAGRLQMAETLINMGAIKSHADYVSVMNTGQLEVATDGQDRQLMLTKDENERMIAGEDVHAVFTERHSLHIEQHRDVLSDASLKNDPELVMRVQAHIQEHIELLRNTDPALLTMMGEQPLGPMAGTPPNPADPNMMPQDMGQMMQGPPTQMQIAQDPTIMPGTEMPQPAAPPAPFDTLPTNPEDMLPES